MTLGGNILVCLSLYLLLRDFKINLKQVCLERLEFFSGDKHKTLETLGYTGSRRVFELVKEFCFQGF